MEENNHLQQLKHVCKLCNKSFPCGRSLGGHMRSHVIDAHELTDKMPKRKNKLCSETETKTETGSYGLREKNPNKTNKIEEDKFCKQCGKGFFSWKALFGHMKCHSDHKGKKRSRTLIKRSNNTSSISEIEIEHEHEEEEEVAMCLMMLSRDGLFDVESSDNNYEFLQVQNHLLSSSSSSANLIKEFECSTCNKTFHSYQALGGHRASHKKMRSCFNDQEQELVQITDSSNGFKKIHRIHQCPVCFKVFQTGQALGGHKRSHLMEVSKNKLVGRGVVVMDRQPPPATAAAVAVFPDLNLPAPVEEESYQKQPWWVLV